MDFENKIIVDDKEKAEVFNDFFASASYLDDSNHPLPDNEIIPLNELSSIEISETDVMDQLNILNTNKAYGPDGIPPKLLKEVKDIVCKPLTKLF